MTDAIIGYGTIIAVGDGASPEVFTEIAEVGHTSPPNPQVEDVDATHYQSPDRAKEYIPGLTEYETTTVEGNFIPGSNTDEYIRTWRASGETRNVKLIYPVTPELYDIYPAYVKGYECDLPNEEKAPFTLTLKVAGAVVRNTD